MKLEWNGMSIEGTPYEIAHFVSEYKQREKQPFKPPYPHWMQYYGSDAGTPKTQEVETVKKTYYTGAHVSLGGFKE